MAYRSAGEQRSVEQQFVSDGFLLPLSHRAYHVGLTRNSSGAWTYTDYFYKSSTYMPWDRNQPAGAGPCAIANTVTARNGIYAFNDVDCSVLRPAICVISRGWQLCDVLLAVATCGMHTDMHTDMPCGLLSWEMLGPNAWHVLHAALQVSPTMCIHTQQLGETPASNL